MARTTRRRSSPLGRTVLWLSASLGLGSLATAGIPPAAVTPARATLPACRTPAARPDMAPLGFFGYSCRDERCGSHKAGFDWAERNGIAQAQACQTRNDPAFIEGCRVFAEHSVTAEQAGFEWARDNGLTDACPCAGAGPGFTAGCKAYVRGFAD